VRENSQEGTGVKEGVKEVTRGVAQTSSSADGCSLPGRKKRGGRTDQGENRGKLDLIMSRKGTKGQALGIKEKRKKGTKTDFDRVLPPPGRKSIQSFGIRVGIREKSPSRGLSQTS